MSAGKGVEEVVSILLAVFTVYLFFLYFGTFLEKRKRSIRMVLGIVVLVFWLMDIPNAIHKIPETWSIELTVVLTLFVVTNIFTGKLWMEVFFSVTFATIWMLVEMLVGSLLIFYGESIVEQQMFGSFVSKLLFFGVILGLRKVFTDEKIMGLPVGHTLLIIFIPIGSIYIMNAVFLLAYKAEWKYAEIYSLVSGVILLIINALVFYIYIKLADDLQIRRMNLVYKKQLDLCERHQEETEISTLQVRDMRHSMRNYLLSILAYAEKGECEELIRFVEDIIGDGKLV